MAFFMMFLVSLCFYAIVHIYFAFLTPLPKVVAFLISLIIIFITNAYWINFILRRNLMKPFPEWLVNLSYFCAAIGFYIVCFYILADVLRILGLRANLFYEGIIIVILSLTVVFFGYKKAKTTVFVNQDIFTEKQGVDLKLAFLSDIHIGSLVVDAKRLKEAFDKINSMNVDAVLIGGDILDNQSSPFIEGNYAEVFKSLKSKYGTFAILGNHEYYGDLGPKGNAELFAKSGMKMLRGEVFSFPEQNVLLIGQDMATRGCKKSEAEKRKQDKRIPLTNSVCDLVSNIDNFAEKYSILLTHTPKFIKDSVENGIDLQLSGHTHNGQMFPANLVVKFMYDNAYGYKKFGKMDSFVSSGFGLWGTPVRNVSNSEIVILNIKSKESFTK